MPTPTQVSSQPQILSLESLISAKLSTYIGRGIQRIQDYADVAKLIEVNQLPLDYEVNPLVRELYQKLWDELEASPDSGVTEQGHA